MTAFPVPHGPVEPAVGYLFVYKGRRLVVSGDTSPSARLEAAAQGADVLAHEALSPRLVNIQRQAALAGGRTNTAAILHDILSYHTTPEEAAGIAQRAHVRYPAAGPHHPAAADDRAGGSVPGRCAAHLS